MRRLVVFATVIFMLSSAIEAQQQRGPSTLEKRALDDLIARRNANTLAAYVHEKTPSCK
jgi:hypothetical protein